MIDTKNSGKDSGELSTIETARLLGLAVRSVQLMVDRGELEAWKTPGGHRRISKASVQRWMQGNAERGGGGEGAAAQPLVQSEGSPRLAQRILLIEDSVHFQNLVSLVVRHALPDAHLDVAPDGITGLAMFGQIQPDVLLLDILLPGIDGATLITALRTSAQFERCRLIVVTSLNEEERKAYDFGLQGLTVVHKSRLAMDLPALLQIPLAVATQDA